MMTEKEDMKTKKGFKLRTVCGENIIVAEGIENVDFSRIISMNETSAYLWKNIQGIDFDENTLPVATLKRSWRSGSKLALSSDGGKMPKTALPLPLIAA